MTTDFENQLREPYSLPKGAREAFRRDGFVKLKNVFGPELLDHYGQAISKSVAKANQLDSIEWSERSTYQKAFIQIMNLWRSDEVAEEFVFSKRCARIAAELMDCSGVRLYHDQALFKEPSQGNGTDAGGHTPWHVDQFYWPLEGEKTVTAWIPLQPVTREMGPLAFATGSQTFERGRDLAISDDSERQLSEAMRGAGFEIEESPFELGEVSFHAGWTFHRAGRNRSLHTRRVMTIIYMDEGARLAQPQNENQRLDRQTWVPGVEVGEVAASPLNPVLWAE